MIPITMIPMDTNKNKRFPHASKEANAVVVPKPPASTAGTRNGHPASSSWSGKRPWAIGLAVAMTLSFGLIFYREWGPGSGPEGLATYVAGAAGFVLFGLTMAGILVWLLYSNYCENKARTPLQRKAARAPQKRALLAAIANTLVYGSGAILMVGALTALDDATTETTIVVAVVELLCVVILVAYTRVRRKKNFTCAGSGSLFLCLFVGFMALLGLGGGLMQVTDGVTDCHEGPQQITATVVSVEPSPATGRYRSLKQDSVHVVFHDSEGNRLPLALNDTDWRQLHSSFTVGTTVALSYYPRTGIIASVEPAPCRIIEPGRTV